MKDTTEANLNGRERGRYNFLNPTIDDPPMRSDESWRDGLTEWQQEERVEREYWRMQDALAASKELPAELEGVKFYNGVELAELVSADITWIVEPWIAAGSITELTGKIKVAGKSTLVTHMVHAVLHGEPFLGKPTLKTPVVYLTEQPPRSFRSTAGRAALPGNPDFHTLFWHKVAHLDWDDIVRVAVAKARQLGARLLVVDGLSRFARLENENDASEADRAMQYFNPAVADGELGVYVVRQGNKAGGGVGDAGRGSSAFGGAADTMITLRRDRNSKPNVRIIEAIDRHDATPERLYIELTEQGYKALGDAATIARDEAETALLDVLPVTEDGALSGPQIYALDALEGAHSRTTIQRALKQLVDAKGLVKVVGTKARPRYYAPQDGLLRRTI